MKNNFKQQLQEVIDQALLRLDELVKKKGEESDFSSHKVLKIKNDNFMFNACGGRYVVEINERNLFDNHGYLYDHSILETFDLMDLMDYLIETYDE